MNILDYVTKFRKAIDKAKDDNRFIYLSPFNNFPRECCEHASDLIAQYLLENGINTRKINGGYISDEYWRHVWLLTQDNIVIDITEEQFITYFPHLKEKLKSIYIDGEGALQKLFCMNRINEPIVNFTNKNEYMGFNNQPNPYQKILTEIYNIIREYL